MAGTAAIGRERPSTNDASKRSAGRYVLGDLLGRGGMAEVFAGHALGDHGFQKPVAIKRLLPELASDHVFVERLIEEAKLLVGMQHGNIVSVLDLARDGDDVFLVMEFVDGPSLRQLLKSRGSRALSLGTATYIVQNAAAGLEFAHGRPGGAIVHADISPSNLLLTTSGEVRVADFGIARREGGANGVVEGKWAYMAPEQARGEPLTARSDVFALGVVLYELICGAHPFGRQVTHEERDAEPMRVIPPRVVKPSIPAGLDAICMRALAHDPRDRYKSMQSLIDAIVEERFTNHWREGASDLAHAIRESNPAAAAQGPRTMVTDRPVTIMTRSLLREVTPARRGSQAAPMPVAPARGRASSRSFSEQFSASEVSQSVSELAPTREVSAYLPPPDSLEISGELSGELRANDASGEVAPLFESGARTNMVFVDDVARAAAMLEQLPPMFRADGTPLPAFQFSTAMAPASPDLSSVVGGHTVTGQAVAAEVGRSNRWTIAVLGIATLIGIAAAIAFHLKPSPTEAATVSAKIDGAATAELPPVVKLPPPQPTFLDKPPAPPAPAPETAAPPEATAATPSAAAPSDPPAAAPTPPAPTDPTPAPPATTEPAAATATDPPPAPRTTRPGQGIRTAPPPRAAVRKEPGWLRVHTRPRSIVSIGNEKQETPWARFQLAPGRYTVRLYYPSLNMTKVHQVTIESQKTFKLNLEPPELDEP